MSTGSHWLNVQDLLAAVFNNEEISAITIEALRDKGWKVSLKNAESIKLQYGSFKVQFDLNAHISYGTTFIIKSVHDESCVLKKIYSNNKSTTCALPSLMDNTTLALPSRNFCA